MNSDVVLRTFAVSMVVYGSAPVVPAAARDLSPEAVHSAEDLKRRIAAGQRRISSFLVEYRYDGYTEEDGFPRGAYLQRIVAATSNGRFYHETAHGHAQLSWKDDPRRQRLYVTEDACWNEWVVNRAYRYATLDRNDELPGSAPEEFLFHATGIWPAIGRPTPKWGPGLPHMLRDVAASEAYAHVRERLETVDGRPCHVLERPGIDALWLDVPRGCALLARERRQPGTGALVERIELSGHREVSPGVWMPAKFRNIQYDYTARTDELRRRKVIDATTDVVRVEVNSVGDELFDFAPPAGALWLNPADGVMRQSESGGFDHLSNLVEWTRKAFPPSGRSGGISHPSWSGLSVLTLAAFVPPVGIWLFRRARRAALVRQRRPI